MALPIETVGDVRRAARVGPYAWPGGYATFFLVDDGEAVCYPCAMAERRQMLWSVAHHVNDGWRAIAFDAVCNYDAPLTCAHCDTALVADDEAPAPDDL